MISYKIEFIQGMGRGGKRVVEIVKRRGRHTHTHTQTQRERERETDRQTDRQTEKDRDRETERQTERQRGGIEANHEHVERQREGE